MRDYHSILLLGLVAVGLVFLYHLYLSPPTYREDRPLAEVTIPDGLTASEIAKYLQDNEVIDSPFMFVLFAKILGRENELKAGRYGLRRGMSELDCVKVLSGGGSTDLEVTLPEGLTVERTAELLAERLSIDPDRFRTLCSDVEMVARLGLEGPSIEGALFPDTYRLSWGADEESVLELMTGRFRQVFAEEAESWTEPNGLSPYEILILASIIEGEALRDDERAVISAVFHNRLRLGRPLQADPTIQYILREHKTRILYEHLKIDSPYNTYLHRGLPPTPICSPGRASIRAALNPADVDYLYFVATGDGSHVFSKTLREHNRARERVKSDRR